MGRMSVAYRSTCLPTIGQPLSVDISTDAQPLCWLICRPKHLSGRIGQLSTDMSAHTLGRVDRYISWVLADMSTNYRLRGAQNTHDPTQLKIPCQEKQVANCQGSNFQGTWWILLICIIISSIIIQVWKECLEIRQHLQLHWVLSPDLEMVSKPLMKWNFCDPVLIRCHYIPRAIYTQPVSTTWYVTNLHNHGWLIIHRHLNWNNKQIKTHIKLY